MLLGYDTKIIAIKIAALFLAITTLTACSGISINNDWDPGADFSQFQTFALLDNMGQPINGFNEQRIVAAIVADLTSKGLQQVDDGDKADLAIGYQVTTEDRTSFQTVHSSWSGHGYRYPSHWGGSTRHSSMHWGTTNMGTSTTTQFNYTVGTLIIAMFEADNKELVWEGSASGTVTQSSRPEVNEQRINDAIQRILRSFPP